MQLREALTVMSTVASGLGVSSSVSVKYYTVNDLSFVIHTASVSMLQSARITGEFCNEDDVCPPIKLLIMYTAIYI